MPEIEVKAAVVVGRVSARTKAAFQKRAKREGRRPSEVLREMIEGYAHPVRPNRNRVGE